MNGLLITNSQTIPLDHISSCSCVERDIPVKDQPPINEEETARGFKISKVHLRAWIVCSIVGGLLIAMAQRTFIGPFIVGTLLAAMPLSVVFMMSWSFFMRKVKTHTKEYAVDVRTTSGGSKLFWSYNLSFVREVHEALTKVLMDDRKKYVSMTINIEKQEITQNSLSFDNSTTNVNNDYSVDYTNYEGISEDQLQFLTSSFQTALQKLGEDVRSASGATHEAVQQLIDAMNDPKPDKTQISFWWNKVKSAHELGDVSVSAYSLLTAGFAILGIS